MEAATVWSRLKQCLQSPVVGRLQAAIPRPCAWKALLQEHAHFAVGLSLLLDRNGGGVLESHVDPLYLWCPLGCLGDHGSQAANRAEEQALAVLEERDGFASSKRLHYVYPNEERQSMKPQQSVLWRLLVLAGASSLAHFTTPCR
jgi:hypothetical protein